MSLASASLRVLLVALFALAVANGAGATAFTLSSTVPFDDGNGTAGNLLPVANLAGTPDCLDGGCDLAGDDVFAFSVLVTNGIVDEVVVSVLVAAFIVDIGHFLDPDTTPSSRGGVPAPPSSTQARFDFDAPMLIAFATGDRLFVTYAAGTLVGGETANIGIQPDGAGSSFNVVGTLAQVPEPATAALVALGLAMLGAPGAVARSR